MTYTVGVFRDERSRDFVYHAYLCDYNPQWRECCTHYVEAASETEAKRLAISEHKEHCEQQE